MYSFKLVTCKPSLRLKWFHKLLWSKLKILKFGSSVINDKWQIPETSYNFCEWKALSHLYQPPSSIITPLPATKQHYHTSTSHQAALSHLYQLPSRMRGDLYDLDRSLLLDVFSTANHAMLKGKALFASYTSVIQYVYTECAKWNNVHQVHNKSYQYAMIDCNLLSWFRVTMQHTLNFRWWTDRWNEANA